MTIRIIRRYTHPHLGGWNCDFFDYAGADWQQCENKVRELRAEDKSGYSSTEIVVIIEEPTP